MSKESKRYNSKDVRYKPLPKVNAVLAEIDDHKSLQADLKHFKASYAYDRSLHNMVHIWMQEFREPETARLFVEAAYTGTFEETKPFETHYFANNSNYSLYQAYLNGLRQQTVYFDEDHLAIIQLLKEDPTVAPMGLIRDKLRIQGEAIALLEIQLKEIQAQNRARKKNGASGNKPRAEANPSATDSAESVNKAEDEIPYPLKDWQLFWSKKFWSADPNHLVPVSTGNREETIEQIADLSRGTASIKPSSIVRALEFHLRKDIIQRALTMKSRFDKGFEDWVKIKRGDDRILLLVPEEQQLIFFAGGRDVIYR